MKKYIRKINNNLSIYEINKKTKKEEIIFYNVNTHNNRAIDRGQIGRLTLEEANIALKYFNYRCAFSGEKFINFSEVTKRRIICNLSLDHIIALVTGGNSLAYNCVPAVLQYNLRKSVHHPLDWWRKQKDINGNEIFNEIRLLKLVNYIIKSLKAFGEQEIKKYKKIIMTPNEADKYINRNKEKLLSSVKTTYRIKDNMAILQEVPYNAKIPKLTDRNIEYEKIKLDLFLLDCIDLLEQYNIPKEIIKYLKKEFKELKEIKKYLKKFQRKKKSKRN